MGKELPDFLKKSMRRKGGGSWTEKENPASIF